MPPEPLDEREFELINIVGAKLGSNQRDLSRQMDMSLGMVNMLLRRLVSKGYIRINQLNKKKVEYILTRKGFSEKMRKSVRYTIKTICSLGLIKRRLSGTLQELINQGDRKFIILGESDFAILVEMVLKEVCKESFIVEHTLEWPKNGFDGCLLICQETNQPVAKLNRPKTVNLVELLAQDHALMGLQEIIR